jgi:hypothetical protein
MKMRPICLQLNVESENFRILSLVRIRTEAFDMALCFSSRASRVYISMYLNDLGSESGTVYGLCMLLQEMNVKTLQMKPLNHFPTRALCTEYQTYG